MRATPRRCHWHSGAGGGQHLGKLTGAAALGRRHHKGSHRNSSLGPWPPLAREPATSAEKSSSTAVGLRAQRHPIRTSISRAESTRGASTMDVRTNPDVHAQPGDDFVRRPVLIEAEAEDPAGRNPMVDVMSRALNARWGADHPAVAGSSSHSAGAATDPDRPVAPGLSVLRRRRECRAQAAVLCGEGRLLVVRVQARRVR